MIEHGQSAKLGGFKGKKKIIFSVLGLLRIQLYLCIVEKQFSVCQ